eukprot:scaffold13843_cov124-Isochrysis_galbana.AAC.3
MAACATAALWLLLECGRLGAVMLPARSPPPRLARGALKARGGDARRALSFCWCRDSSDSRCELVSIALGLLKPGLHALPDLLGLGIALQNESLTVESLAHRQRLRPSKALAPLRSSLGGAGCRYLAAAFSPLGLC